ncbi:MAG: Eco57I restriction-modification methylase domain-containing protein [Rhizobiaceae bacterium]
MPDSLHCVIGNPPYVRHELIPDVLIVEYRARYNTVYDRADVYIPFIERSLSLLRPEGSLGFICADRWMKNRYGGPLRAMVARDFHLKIYVGMVDTPAFHADVIAYPAITVITREKPGTTRVAHRPKIESESLTKLAEMLLAKKKPEAGGPVKELVAVADSSQLWILESSDQLVLVRRPERDFPSI